LRNSTAQPPCQQPSRHHPPAAAAAAMVNAPSAMLRTNRTGGGVGTSPGINPITPYTTAALDYRASWIGGEMRAKTGEYSNNQQSAAWTETLNNEARGMANFSKDPPKRRELPHPVEKTKYLETSGLERSLATNIPDHPTAIQVNGLRMERVEGVVCPGYVDGVGSYDSRVLCGNWNEERADKAYVPSEGKQSTGRQWMWQTTYEALTEHANHMVRPGKVSNAATLYTDPSSRFGTGVIEESKSSNKEIVKLGGTPGVDYIPGDPRSASRPAGNYVNYQCGKQHVVSCFGGRELYLKPFETTAHQAFSDPAAKHMASSTERCDLYKPAFQVRDPGRDGVSKMMCTVKADEFACDRMDADYLDNHIFGFPVPGKQKPYTLNEYRARWTKSTPEVVAAGMVDTTEHRKSFVRY